ncbi:cytochrome C oxidase assembly protein [Shimia haliotis]|uniref:Cytochrome C oxidase assembly protein n=1 Tax=Shimia haliotis TaxID=1280847 RepID=A0A1I4G0S9_9RHOB|nr:cytochrome C oxidase assembly protein [Shimia haliotis]SFL23329.1 hypothetical protein SAMN04488036_10781 [Shimia haliotis]
MSFKEPHELHKRRFGRNLGVALVLTSFIFIVFGLTYVKITRGDYEPANASVER